MKTLLKNLWTCRNNVFIAWLFFFCLSLAGKTPHGIFILFLISGGWAIGVTLLGILYVKSGWYRKS